ncbi:hypothetical protein [Flavobacterium sp. ZB4R12]|uniref:hypothetical protein n=1 Tax=Flavobacterium sp. ZB4R12 TaxID=3398732 RepID=UPI003AAE4968
MDTFHVNKNSGVNTGVIGQKNINSGINNGIIGNNGTINNKWNTTKNFDQRRF